MSISSLAESDGLFVLFYGDPLGADGERILEVAPSFVVLGAGTERYPDVPRVYHAAGVRVLAYVALGYGRARADEAIHQAMSAGFDGIFFDETHGDSHVYNRSRSAVVRGYGADKIVVMNPGMAAVEPTIFDHADIVCVENQHDRDLAPEGLDPWRWMAAQGDPAPLAAPDVRTAIERLLAFRARGGFWYFSAPHAEEGATHVTLPPWFEEFASEVRALSRAAARAKKLAARAAFLTPAK